MDMAGLWKEWAALDAGEQPYSIPGINRHRYSSDTSISLERCSPSLHESASSGGGGSHTFALGCNIHTRVHLYIF